jgi:hypothetical protein
MQIQLTNGKYVLIERAFSKTFKYSKAIRKIIVEDFVVVCRSSNLFIICFVWDIYSQQCFVISYHVNNDRLSVVDQIKTVKTPDSTKFFCKDESGQCFAVACDRYSLPTEVSVTQVDIDNSGKITTQILLSEQLLQGLWTAQFIHSNYLYCSSNKETEKTNLLKVSLQNRQIHHISVTDNIDFWPNMIYNMNLDKRIVSVGRQEFLICARSSSSKKCLDILIFNLKELCWQTVSVDLAEDFISTRFDTDENSTLYVSLRCVGGTSRIFAIKFRENFMIKVRI